jgi:hypothetical protein
MAQLAVWLSFKKKAIDEGTKYLGFDLKPNGYMIHNWLWLPNKIKERVTNWTFKTLSRGGRFFLINFVLSNIDVY